MTVPATAGLRPGVPKLVLAAAGLHLGTMALPSVNMEFAFADAVRHFMTGDPAALESYFRYQANSVGLPWLASQLALLVPGLGPLAALRLLSLLAFVVAGLALGRLAQRLWGQAEAGLVLLFLLNPLVWTFGGRGTADLAPAGFGLAGLALGLGARTWGRAVLAGLFLGLAGIVKVHALALLLQLVLLQWACDRSRLALGKVALACAVAVCCVAAFLLWSHGAYGFWLTPPQFQQFHRPAIAHVANNFILYAGFLTLLAVPASLLHWRTGGIPQRGAWWLLALAVLAFAAGGTFLHSTGEMNLGPLDRWVPSWLSLGTFSALAAFAMLPPFLARLPEPGAARVVRFGMVSVLAVLLVLAVSRPAQRYLLVVLPTFLLLLPRPATWPRLVLPATALVFALVNAFLAASQWSTGTAAEAMAREVERRGLAPATGPGAIEHHVGNRFRTVRPELLVVRGDHPGALHVAAAGAGPFRAAFSLVRQQEAGAGAR